MRSAITLPISQTLRRALQLLEILVDSVGEKTVPIAAAQIGIKTSTAYRLVAELQQAGMLTRVGKGRYFGGVALHRLAQADTMNSIVVAIARPFLKKLSDETGRVAHLGIFEDDMVTYLIREAPADADVFTREGMQLEAYCTAVGQVLLCGLPPRDLDRYIETGQFVALTPYTVTDPETLRKRLALARQNGYARDKEESNIGLTCVSVPLETEALGRCYALSLSGPCARIEEDENLLLSCRLTAARLAVELNRRPTGR